MAAPRPLTSPVPRPHQPKAVHIARTALLLVSSFAAMGDKPIVFEAENAARLEGPFEFCRDDAASGGLGIRVREGMGTDFDDDQTRELHSRYPDVGFSTTPGGAEYALLMPEHGHYITWARVCWLWECSNSFWVGAAVPDAPIVTDRLYHRWHWVRASRRVLLREGRQTFRISNREDGVRVDQLCLTRDPGFRPAGILRPNALFAREAGQTPPRLFPVASVPLVFAKTPTPCTLWIRNTHRQPRTLDIRAATDETISVTFPDATDALAIPGLTGLLGVPFIVATVQSRPLRQTAVRLTVTPREGAPGTTELPLTHAPNWEVAGPFGRGTPQSPPTPDWRATGTPRAVPIKRTGALTWHPVAEPRFFTGSGRLDLTKLFPHRTHCWAYIQATFHWDGNEVLPIQLRSDDQSVVWLNGERVCSHPVVGPGERYFTPAQLRLRKGENTLTAAIAQAEAFWEISLTPSPP